MRLPSAALTGSPQPVRTWCDSRQEHRPLCSQHGLHVSGPCRLHDTACEAASLICAVLTCSLCEDSSTAHAQLPRLPPHPAPDACCLRTRLLSVCQHGGHPFDGSGDIPTGGNDHIKMTAGDGPQRSSGNEGHVIFRKTVRHLVGRPSALPRDRSMRMTGSSLGSRLCHDSTPVSLVFF